MQRRLTRYCWLLHSRDAFSVSATPGSLGKWVGARPSWQGASVVSQLSVVGMCLPVTRRRSRPQARPVRVARGFDQTAFVKIERALRVAPRLREAYLARAQLTRTARNRFPHEAAITDREIRAGPA
jgi:hypothetical protein